MNKLTIHIQLLDRRECLYSLYETATIFASLLSLSSKVVISVGVVGAVVVVVVVSK